MLCSCLCCSNGARCPWMLGTVNVRRYENRASDRPHSYLDRSFGPDFRHDYFLWLQRRRSPWLQKALRLLQYYQDWTRFAAKHIKTEHEGSQHELGSLARWNWLLLLNQLQPAPDSISHADECNPVRGLARSAIQSFLKTLTQNPWGRIWKCRLLEKTLRGNPRQGIFPSCGVRQRETRDCETSF